jgi:glycosyltransferase involved in cell wall biosynthesis
MLPSVSIICVCYNHERFVAEALDSVLGQTYPNLEIIVVDDASTDNSVSIIQAYCTRFPQIKFIRHKDNMGNCTAFNTAWRRSRGNYIIDFATDDVMLKSRVEEQVTCFSGLEASFGVVYTDVQKIDSNSRLVGSHYQRNKNGVLKVEPPSGDLFSELLQRYFIDPTSMMFRREVLEELGGYDESLAYEDFDFWVRSSRKFKYFFLNKILSRRRVHANSLSNKAYKRGDTQLSSTILVCYKAFFLFRTAKEKDALIVRVKSEIRQAFFTENYSATGQLLQLLCQLDACGMKYKIIGVLNKYRVRLSLVRKVYYLIRYGRVG